MRETGCGPIPVPASMAADVAGYRWSRSTVGESGGDVYRLHGKAGSPDLYLKRGAGQVAGDIGAEAARLRWLAGRLPVPVVVDFVQTSGQAWLLMTALPGHTAYQLLTTRPYLATGVVDALAAFLRQIHAIPVDACPFDSALGPRLARARGRIDAGLVDEDDFDEEQEGWTAEQVWDAMQALLPLDVDPVVTHGDYSLDNLLICDGQVSGCIDAGRVGKADRYQDLAIAWNCLAEFGAALQQRFLEQYGIREPDRRKLQLHLMLDELF